MLLIQSGFGLSIKKGHMFGFEESKRKILSIRLPFITIHWLNREATSYWYKCALAAFNDPNWFIENHHAVRQAKRKATTTYMKAYQEAWKEHRDRYQQDMEKLESENMQLRRKFTEAKRDIDAYKRLIRDNDEE
ncbi:hypothetical protein R1N98_004368 [Salmonella enterica]|nr:hypothetical protein [Salmonella enterica]EBR8005925.1 hypothetical protein [Salmonella enterica subsp. enterica serovar Saintpaul]EBW4447104.1 hypothetical protein [Salmonella enterica subsp. enterica serovar Arechavaleta]EBW6743349.1 hypothetical protein [Salmonella enterica subsp. enterica serovar Richmond]EDH1234134.1 hypothetical protein [Salmonella enterica subsp. enterica]EDN5783827.1 hypothetical protein [Salmonella enterica subsp. enterica serovar Newport]